MDTTQTQMQTVSPVVYSYELVEVSTGKTMARRDDYGQVVAAVTRLNAIRASEGSMVRYACRQVWL